MNRDDIYGLIGRFILQLIPDADVVVGLVNLVPSPPGPHVRITPAGIRRLRTNEDSYDFQQSRVVTRGEELGFQLDFYGPNAGDWASVIETMFRDPMACDALAPCAPFYCTDPHQSPLINGEENYEQRYIMTALLQYNPTVTVRQDYADSLGVTLVSVDETFKP